MKNESDTIICVCRVTDGSDIPQSMRVGWRAKDRPGGVMPSLEPSLWSEKTVQARMQDRYRKKAVLYFRLPQLQITPFFFFFFKLPFLPKLPVMSTSRCFTKSDMGHF